MARFFISYSRVDRPFVDDFVPRIRRAYRSHTFWYDRDLHGGDAWWAEILDQIAQCDVFIYLLSNDSVESEYCRREYEEAVRLQKQILPIQIRARTRVPDDLRAIHYVDMSKGLRDADARDDLYASINNVLENLPSEAPEPLSPEPPPMPVVPQTERGGGNRRGLLVGLAALLMLAVIGVGFVLFSPDPTGETAPTPTIPPTEVTTTVSDVAQEPTETPTQTVTDAPTESATPSQTPSITPTPDVAAAALTVIAQQTAQAIVDAATATSERATQAEQDRQQQAADQTATATLWTDTPTQDFTASVESLLTQWAQQTATQDAVNATATATLWTATPTATQTPTDTPTATQTPTDTPTATPTATLAPEQIAQTPQPSNAGWQPHITERGFDGVTMVLVPAGCFEMGSDDAQIDYAVNELGVDREWMDDEQPVHEQCFDEPFWIDKYEVTNEDYGSVVCDQRSSEPDQPRNCVTWFDARDHCEGRGARLPTEAEWEYAARGPDSLVYPWGNAYNAELVIGEDDPTYGDTRTAPVGSRPGGASWVGALDMSGNVWEWTSSLYADYPYAPDHESNNTDNSARVLRGGSFLSTTLSLRSALRSDGSPSSGIVFIGFRCALS